MCGGDTQCINRQASPMELTEIWFSAKRITCCLHPDWKHPNDWKVLLLANISSRFPVCTQTWPTYKGDGMLGCSVRSQTLPSLGPEAGLSSAWVIWWLGCRMFEGEEEVAQFPACVFLLHIYFYILPPARNAHFLFFSPFSHLFILPPFEGQAQLKPELWGLPRAWQWFSRMHLFLHIFWNTHQSLTAYCIFHMRTSLCLFQGTAVFGRSAVRKLYAREAYRREGVLNGCFLDRGF